MNEHQSGWPPRFDAFLAHRTRFLDRMAADALIGQIERAAGPHVPGDGPRTDAGTAPGPDGRPDRGGPAGA